MTSIITKLKKLSQNYNFSLFLVIGFFVIVLIFGIKATYAYYHDTQSVAVVSTLVGDFDSSNGDIIIEVYKKDGGLYVKNYAVPAIGYSLTTVDCTVAACETTNTSSNCYYDYSESTNVITLASDQKVTCKFYFDPLTYGGDTVASDITVYIMKENINVSTNPKTYELVQNIPAYGYAFASATCDNGDEPTYNANTRTFNLQATSPTECYAYFNALGTSVSDIKAHIYVQTTAGSSVYTEVESIPVNREYEIHEVEPGDLDYVSTCIKDSDSTASTAPTYVDGYVNINADEPVTCNVYLDLVTE